MATKSWEQVKAQRLRAEAARAGYEQARQSMQIGERVRAVREAHGLSQRELAERVGSTQPAIARLEAGGVNPSLATLERIAAALESALVIDFAPTPPTRARPKPARRVASA
jgi:HTH-type transcriptional regulator / antitoxin HipB